MNGSLRVKVILGKEYVTQHRLLICDLVWQLTKVQKRICTKTQNMEIERPQHKRILCQFVNSFMMEAVII